MARTAFENLKVYRLAEQLADEVWNLASQWDNFSKDTLGKQLVRSIDSVGANIAEGAGRGAYQDNQRFVRIARGSLNESIHWLRRAYKRNLYNRCTNRKDPSIIGGTASPLECLFKFNWEIEKAADDHNGQLATNNRQQAIRYGHHSN